jgi:hypothetical protein
MPIAREPLLNPVPIAELRPTQITVGMREVRAKQKEWRKRDPQGGAAFLGKHMVPVVLGPNKHHYVTDHHHLARALHEEGVSSVLVTVISDLSTLEKDAFWFFLDNRALMHPFDAEGKRRDYSEIPKRSKIWSTIPTALLPANCVLPAAIPRTRHRSANSCGPISCAGGYERRILPGISIRR